MHPKISNQGTHTQGSTTTRRKIAFRFFLVDTNFPSTQYRRLNSFRIKTTKLKISPFNKIHLGVEQRIRYITAQGKTLK